LTFFWQTPIDIGKCSKWMKVHVLVPATNFQIHVLTLWIWKTFEQKLQWYLVKKFYVHLELQRYLPKKNPILCLQNRTKSMSFRVHNLFLNITIQMNPKWYAFNVGSFFPKIFNIFPFTNFVVQKRSIIYPIRPK